MKMMPVLCSKMNLLLSLFILLMVKGSNFSYNVMLKQGLKQPIKAHTWFSKFLVLHGYMENVFPLIDLNWRH